MEEELYRKGDILSYLRRLNPHLELKEAVKNIGDFTLDLVLHLSDQETRVKIPMDTFRKNSPEDRIQMEERIQEGYAALLRKLG